MLKTPKFSHKSHKSKDSAMRKSHLSKKMRSRSPVRLSGSSRPPPMKHISPGMKRGHPVPKRKASHSPRLRSIASPPHRSLSHRSKPESPVSIDRLRTMKTLKYDKRKRLSNSPVRHLGPGSPHRPVMHHEARDMSPYHAERYQNSSSIVHSPQYSPTRKKTHREPERYFGSRSMSVSPPRRHMANPIHPESHIPHRVDVSPPSHNRHRLNIPLGHGEREKHNYDIRHKHHDSPVMPISHSKDVPMKVPYPNTNSRFRSASPGNRYLSGSKSYGPTLHERFSSVIDRTEPRVRFSREDLEKITIDITRNVRDPSPTLRHMMNPSDIKLVRRTNEGHRSIFDREEIKQASKDLRDDAYYERKTGSYSSARPIDLREVENYQITRHRFESHQFPPSSGRSLSDRWQNHDTKKEAMTLDRDEREKDYQRPPIPRHYVDSTSRSRPADQDFRSERYLDVKPSSSRSDYQNRLPVAAAESRNSIPYPHRKSSVPMDARHKLNVRKGDRESHPSAVRPQAKEHYLGTDRHYAEPIPSRVERREPVSPVPIPHKWDYKSRSPSRDNYMDFPPRPDKYGYKSWIDKPDVSTKSTSYLEHDSHEGPSTFRGSSRPFRSSRGFRSRGFRGPSRGSTFYRGSFRGGYRTSTSPRARGISRR